MYSLVGLASDRSGALMEDGRKNCGVISLFYLSVFKLNYDLLSLYKRRRTF